jgi:3-oxoacyl-[acyl-carrier-protein] synthase-3
MSSDAATSAGREALEKAGLSSERVGALFNCSVTRDYFEPATACIVASKLGVPEHAMALDITNACIGFSNGMLLMSQLIESGIVEVGLVVAAENVTPLVEASIAKLNRENNCTRTDLLRIMPVFTLGCGAAAMVLCHERVASSRHAIRAAVARSATQHVDLCLGDGDYCLGQEGDPDPLMYTDSAAIVPAAADLGSRVWPELSEITGWSRDDIDHIFCHQIGKQVNEQFYSTIGLNVEKEFSTYQEFGNLVSASLPAALFTGAEKKAMKAGDKIVLTAFGSGLNAIISAIQC